MLMLEANGPKPKEAPMRLTLNRIVALAAIAAAGLMAGCSADSPGPTSNPNPGGPGGSSGIVVTLTPLPQSPIQGNCSLITVSVTQNGAPVPAGTSVNLSTTFGTFGQNGLQTISLETTAGGTAATTVCSNNVGPATVTGRVVIGTKTGTGMTTVNFQSNGEPTGPFISVCATPHTGPTTGGTPITISGGGFGTTAANVRVFFRSGGVVHQGIISSVTDSSINVTTPAFPELNGVPATPVEVDVVLNGQTLTSPSCFTYTSSSEPVVTAILPASGTKIGGTRVTIVGSGFSAPVQVFFGGTLEAQVVSVSPDQIIAITPPANAQGPSTTFPQNVDVTVKEVNCSGAACTGGPVTYTYTVGMSIFAFTPDHGDSSTVVTITGQGFVAPLVVTFGGQQGNVISVTGTQILAKPPAGCPSSGGTIGVTLLSDGETATAPGTFTINVPTIASFAPESGPGGSSTSVTAIGTDFFPAGSPSQVSVTVDGISAVVTSVSEVNGQQTLVFGVNPPVCSASVTVTIVNRATGCTISRTFTNSTFSAAGPTVSAITSQPGPAAMQVTYSASATGGTAPYTFSWNFGATNTPNPATRVNPGVQSGETNQVTVTYNCSACAVDPANLTVTDQCGHAVPATPSAPATTQ
jgi:hypothetical protein